MENDAGPDLSAGNPVDLAPTAPQQPPGVGQGMWGSNRTMIAPVADSDPLAAAEATATAQRDQAQRKASSPLWQLMSPDEAKQFGEEATRKSLEIQQIKQARQAQTDMRAKAANMGLNPASIPATATDNTLLQMGLDRFKQGDLNAYKGLVAAGHKDLVDAYMPDAVSAMGAKVEKAQTVIQQLDSAPNQAAYNAVRNHLTSAGHELAGAGLGLDSIPKTMTEWSAKRGGIVTSMANATRMVQTYQHQLDQLGDFSLVTDEKVAKTYGAGFKLSNGEVIPGANMVTRAKDGVQGVQLAPGSKDVRNFGASGKDGWNSASPEQTKTVREQLGAEEVKGAIGKYKMAKEFAATANNDQMYKSAAGIALLSDELGAIGRDVAEGSKAAGSIGLTKMLESKYGHVEGFLNTASKEISAYKAWVNGGKKGPEPRLSAQSIQGIKDIANFKAQQTKGELGERIAQPLETAGRYGIGLDKLGLDNEAQALGAGFHAAGVDKTKQDIASHPYVISGDTRVLLPKGEAAKHVDGAKYNPLPAGALSSTPQGATGSPSPSGGGGVVPTAPAGSTPPAGGGGTPVSPTYTAKLSTIETGSPGGNYTAPPNGSGASGRYQFVPGTWNQFKPPGAPDAAYKATPAQQDAAYAAFTQANAQALTAKKLPVNDVTMYMAHQQGAEGAAKLLTANLNAKAADVVGERNAKANPAFFYSRDGRPLTVQESGSVFAQKMQGTGQTNATDPNSGAGSRGRPSGAPQTDAERTAYQHMRNLQNASATHSAADLAPAALGTLGGTVGTLAGPWGTAGGAAAGGAAGGAVKNYFNGGEDDQNAAGYAAAAGKGVVEAAPMMVPGAGVLPAAARVAAAAVGQGGIKYAETGDAGAAVGTGLAAGAGAVGGEALARGAGIIGHSVWQRLSPAAQEEMYEAAKTVATKPAKIAGVGGKMVDNPEYVKAQQSLESIGKSPEQAAHDYRAVEEGMTKGEALSQRPAAVEKAKVGQEYDAIKGEIKAAGVGAPKASPRLPDGPASTIRDASNPGGTVPAKYAKDAQDAELRVTAPAKSWDHKWQQLGEARSDLLTKERDALSGASPNTEKAAAMRALADSVRVQQEKAAVRVLGPQKGAKVIERLQAADKRYAIAMKAAGPDGDIAGAIAEGGPKGREAKRAFDALAGNDPAAQRMVNALVHLSKGKVAQEVSLMFPLIASETFAHGVPLVSGTIGAVKATRLLRDWMIKRGAGATVTFGDMLHRAAPDNFKRVVGRAGATLGSGGAAAATN